MKIKLLESKLKANAAACLDQNVPVGISTTTSGKFFVRYSLGQPEKFHETLDAALDEILNK